MAVDSVSAVLVIHAFIATSLEGKGLTAAASCTSTSLYARWHTKYAPSCTIFEARHRGAGKGHVFQLIYTVYRRGYRASQQKLLTRVRFPEVSFVCARIDEEEEA